MLGIFLVKALIRYIKPKKIRKGHSFSRNSGSKCPFGFSHIFCKQHTVSTCVETSELLSFLLVGLRKYVQRLISLWKHINGLQLLHCMFLVQLTSRITYLLQRIISMINCSVPSSNCLTPLGVKPCRK